MASTNKRHVVKYWDGAKTKKRSEGDMVGWWIFTKKDGLWTEWYDNGVKSGEATYQHGKWHGVIRSWSRNGQMSAEGHFVQGVRHGPVRAWYENGQQADEGENINGRIHGKAVSWYENGQMKVISENKDGNKHGKYTEWYENGQMKCEGEFTNGIHNGKSVEWYENGQIKYEDTILYGVRKGPRREWDVNGKILMDMPESIMIDVDPDPLVKLQKGEAAYSWEGHGFVHQIDILSKEHQCLVLTRQYPSMLAFVLAIIPGIVAWVPIVEAGKASVGSLVLGTCVAVAIFLPLHEILGVRMRGQHVERLSSHEVIRIVRGVDTHPGWPHGLPSGEFKENPPQKLVYHVFAKSSRKPGRTDVYIFCLALTRELCNRDAYLAWQDELDSVIASIHAVERV